MTERIFNFSAGPAVLPLPVLEEAQRDMLSLPGVGMSVMEISHRSKTFDEIFTRGGIRLQRTAGRAGQLSRSFPARWREPAVFHGPDELSAGRQKR